MDVIQFLSHYRVPFKRHGEDHHVSRSGWIGVHCPWCGSSAYHLGIHVESGRANCWQCGGHDAIEALSRLTKQPRRRVVSEVDWRRQRKAEGKPLDRQVIEPDNVEPLLPAHRRYLEGRGFDPDEVADVWGVQGIGPSHRLSWRLYIPIYDKFGRLVSWTTRAISEEAEPRYLSASHDEEAVDHKTLLYGSHLVRRGTVIVVEGPLDAWAIGPGAVATFGTGFSSVQRATVSSYPHRVLCLDSEDRAQRRSAEVFWQMETFPGQTYQVTLETGKDPAECDRSELDSLRETFLQIS